MTNLFAKWTNGFLIGAMVAVLEGLIIWVADPNTQFWIIVQSVCFWLFCGLVVHMTETGLPIMLNSILLTVLLNIPWYISLSIVPGNWGKLIPLVIASIIFGGMIGLASQKLKTKPA